MKRPQFPPDTCMLPTPRLRPTFLVFALACLAIVASFPGILAAQQHRTTSRDAAWVQRAAAIGKLFRREYTAGWQGANGAIGNAYLFAATGDSSLLRFHLAERPMQNMINGTWVDDRAWICLAELLWWRFTGRTNRALVDDARQRYDVARKEGRLSRHEGYWAWYNWAPQTLRRERVFTNSNMNQMVAVACGLFEATGEQRYLDDALLVWRGDGTTPGIVQALYKGGGVWEGRPGLAAFGKELPWHGAEYCSIGAAMYRVTKDVKIREMIVATARHILDPATGWLDPKDWYQIHMDGNGAFVNYLLDAYMTAPNQLRDIPDKVGKMLEHVWTNHHGRATVTLRRESDNAIRNGWNPDGGEDGYGVDEVGTVHAQSQALRAFGAYAFVKTNAWKRSVKR